METLDTIAAYVFTYGVSLPAIGLFLYACYDWAHDRPGATYYDRDKLG